MQEENRLVLQALAAMPVSFTDIAQKLWNSKPYSSYYTADTAARYTIKGEKDDCATT